MSETTVDFRKRMVKNRQQELISLDYDSLRRVIDKSLTPTGWSLEAGSGLGRYVHYLDARGFASVGVEISSEITRKAKRLFPASDFIVGDVRQLPIRSDCIRNLLSLGVIEHFADSQALVTESTRVLQTNGVMVTTVPNQYSFWPYIRSYLQRSGKWDIGYERSLTKPELRKILETSGLQVDSVRETKAISTLLQLLMLMIQKIVTVRAPNPGPSPLRDFYLPREKTMRKVLPIISRIIDSMPIISRLGFLIVAVSRKSP
jgi:SAM-dependent methyltransferase